MIVEVELYAMIRKRYLKGESIRSISRGLGIARQTVNKYCEGKCHPEIRKPYERKPSVVTDEIKTFILTCFELDEQEGLRKQHHTAKRIYDRLVKERCYQGSYSSIRIAVRELKELRVSPAKSMVPLAYAPGEAAQIDWGEATVYENGKKTKMNLFCGRAYAIAAIYLSNSSVPLITNPFWKPCRGCLTSLAECPGGSFSIMPK